MKYYNFFDIQQMRTSSDRFHEGPESYFEKDFVDRFATFLTNNTEASPNKSVSIASCVYELMTDKSLHYHTPIHVMSIFDFASKHLIKITPEEKMAIYFHDACYDINHANGTNEFNSALLFHSLVGKYAKEGFSNRRVEELIVATSKHMEKKVQPEVELILDLDLCSFAFDKKDFDEVTNCIAKEYPVSREKFDMGRKNFIKNLLDRGFIYRSNDFKPFEKIAFENLSGTQAVTVNVPDDVKV